MLLSVIIPVYNVEQYLNKCVDSVLNQHLEDYEIILVDDGSSDKSSMICDEYSLKYAEIKVIHQDNAGASAARNAGIKAAKGDYIIFADSDDWWNSEVDVCSILAQVQEKPYIEMFLFTSLDYVSGDGFYQRSEHKNLKSIRTDNVDNYYSDLINNGNLEVSPCTKILKRDFIIDNNLFFKSGIVGEDNEWMIRILRVLKRVMIIDEPLYLCRIDRKGSVSHTISLKNIKDLLSIVVESLRYHADHSSLIKQYELSFCSYLWFSALGLNSQLKHEDKKAVYPLFKKTASVCQYSNSSKTRLAYAAYKVCGIKLTSLLLGFYIRMKNTTRINREKVSLS